MKWYVIIPDSPPSVNHSYKPVMVRRKDGTRGMRIAKQPEVERFQTLVSYLTRSAKPSGWAPMGEFVRVTYRFFLKRSIDCDNAMKAMNDAIADAILINDARFLPCVISKSVDPKEPLPRVEVEIGDPSDWP